MSYIVFLIFPTYLPLFLYNPPSDDRLNLAEFSIICRALFRNDKGHIYDVPPERLEQIFAVFDTNGDGFIDREEFKFCWNQWIKTVSRCDPHGTPNSLFEFVFIVFSASFALFMNSCFAVNFFVIQ